jgi:hypothetical protein
MTEVPRRHLLVIASTNPAGEISDLDAVARRLHAVMIDPTAGACVPGLPDGESLKVGDLEIEDVRRHIKTAVAYAAQAHATLVLALLGHAFIPGEEPSLYFMASDSVVADRLSAIHVNNLLVEATDQFGVNGVVGVIDTCHAGAAAAGSGSTTGNRAGRNRVAMLLAATASQLAYDLALSRHLTDLLESGLVDAGARIDVATAAGHINARVVQHNVVFHTADGDPGPASALWLGHNRRHPSGPPGAGGLLGSRGRRALRDALALVDDPGFTPAADARSPGDLEDLADSLAALPDSVGRNRAATVVRDLTIAMHTTAFIRRRLSVGLTRDRLCAALRFALPHRSPADLITETDFVEEIALVYPVGADDCRSEMAHFIVSLSDSGGLDATDSDLRGWTDTIMAAVPSGDAWRRVEARRLTRDLRLAITMHGSTANGWPEALEAWLLGDDDVPPHETFGCRPAQRPGVATTARDPEQTDVERTLREVVDWAEDLVEEIQSEGVVVRFNRVDIALSTRLLLSWRPAEVVHGMRLGVDYDVLHHWSRRADPRIRRHASKRLRAIADAANRTTPGARVAVIDWLDATDTADIAGLKQRLESGEFLRGLGVAHNLTGNERLADLLLTYAPILVWTSSDEPFSGTDRQAATNSWHRLPEGFLEAYRNRWNGTLDDVLADLDFVWDDTQWLKFCHEYSSWPPS